MWLHLPYRLLRSQQGCGRLPGRKRRYRQAPSAMWKGETCKVGPPERLNSLGHGDFKRRSRTCKGMVRVPSGYVWILSSPIGSEVRGKQDSSVLAAKSLQLCPILCNPIDGSPLGSSIPGILQARTLEWVAISFSSAWKWKVKVKSLSRARLLATPWTSSSVHGIFHCAYQPAIPSEHEKGPLYEVITDSGSLP